MEEDVRKSIVNHFEAGANCQVFTGNNIGCTFAMPGANVTQQCPQAATQPESQQPTLSILLACVGAVREYFWGDSSLAVVFGVCRDCYGYSNNMAQFERDFGCQEGLVANTFRNNPYMRLPMYKWAQNGAKDRVLRLVEAYKKAVDERLIS